MKRFFSKKYVILTILSLLLITFIRICSISNTSTPFYVTFENSESVYSDINWINSNPYERSKSYQLHAFIFMESDLLKYQETNNKDFLIKPLKYTLEWANLFTDMDFEQANKINGCEQFIWYDMAVGLRANTLSYLIKMAQKENILTQDEYNILYKCLLRHAEYLLDDKNVKFHNNHGLFQVAGQLSMAKRFYNQDKIFKQSYKQAKKRIKKIYNNQFTPNGIHKEHSPEYADATFNTLKKLKLCIIHLQQIENNLDWFYTPKKHLATLGDTSVNIKKNIKEFKNYGYFNKDGYFIVRQSNKNNNDSTKDSYLAQIGAFYSRVHKHADNLSFIWHDLGEEILIDSGKFGYSGKTSKDSKLAKQGFYYSNPNRIYIEKTLAHNALEIDNLDHPRVKKEISPFENAIKLAGKYGDVYASTSSFVMRGVEYTRLLIFNPSKWLIVMDKYDDKENKKHGAKQWFHISPNLELVKINEQKYKIKNNNIEILVSDLLNSSNASKIYYGQKEPFMQGWYAVSGTKLEPNFAFNYSQNNSSGLFATLFEIQNNSNLKDGISLETVAAVKRENVVYLLKFENNIIEIDENLMIKKRWW